MAMTDGATRLKSPIVSQAQGLSRPTIHTAMRGTIGVVIVLAVAAAFWYARTAIFLAFAGILLAIVLHGASKALSRISRLPSLVALTIVVALIAAFSRWSSAHQGRRSRSRSLSSLRALPPASPI